MNISNSSSADNTKYDRYARTMIAKQFKPRIPKKHREFEDFLTKSGGIGKNAEEQIIEEDHDDYEVKD